MVGVTKIQRANASYWLAAVTQGGDDYYTKPGEAAGEWVGDLAEENTKVATVSVVATETRNDHSDIGEEAFVGDAAMELGDTDAPNITANLPSQWVNQTPANVPFYAEDSGLGVSSVTLKERKQGGRTWKTAYGCLGVADSACPRLWTTESGSQPSLSYEPGGLPQGFAELEEYAEDPVGNKSVTVTQQVKVDHTAPKLAVSGTITEQGTLGTKRPTYALNYTATDGEVEAATALAPFGNSEAGNMQMKRALGIASDRDGHVWMVDREANCVKEFDEEGHYITQFGTTGSGNGQISDPREIAISPTGNLWVAEVGNHRVQEFTQQGQFIRKIESSEFKEPYGIATGPGETLWISDLGAHSLFLYRENGTFVRKAYGGGNNNNGQDPELVAPLGVATDSIGDAWLVDNANVIREFDPEGKFLTKFGTTGSGNGQLKTPVSIAVAPSGNLLVTENVNNRVQVLQPDGTYLRQFGATGSGTGQLSEPRGIAVGANNVVFVADAGNHRVARWSHADYDPQSGVVSTEVKVDGKAIEPKYESGCSTKDCQISKEWTLESSNYAAGQHTLEVIATDGVGLQTPKSVSFEVNPAPPSLALSGSMTEQGTLGNARPRYTLKAEAAPNSQGGEAWAPTFLSAFGATGSGTGQLNGPRGVAADGKGHVWVVDRSNNRVEEFNESGEYLG